MATTAQKEITAMSIYQKLAQARLEFLSTDVKKSGINTDKDFEYFELKDIVPAATDILARHGLIFIVTFPDGVPTGTLYDFTSDTTITFFSTKIDGDILTTRGNKLMMDIQAEGAKQTYHRRYLYMQLLDIVEQDEIDSVGKDTTKPATPPAAAKKAAPVSDVKREEIKKEVTDSAGQAEPIQIEQLKKALAALNKADPTQEEFIQAIVVKTNNFTELSKDACTQLILKIGTLIDEVQRGVVE